MPSEFANQLVRSPERCGAFCDAPPAVEFTDEWGVTNRVCPDCYHRSCGRCGGEIRDAYKRKGLCEACRREIRSWRSDDAGRDPAGDPAPGRQATLVDGGFADDG